jgi:uncharacterized protein YbaR (Trm112 family)
MLDMPADASHPARTEVDATLRRLIAEGIIVCPVTRRPLLEDDGTLRAGDDAPVYEIAEGIPRLRPPRPFSDGGRSSAPRETTDEPA